ncbi:beta strand repeat-containing protein [Ectothiorhodospira mobilis]|uniref:beta strand repeat-containing protein n=1 Tax=Ectothiorhodospira mobilis TaxID=195064 RepID=UPI001EE92E02|nr:DUF4214 domain-containing protein [Ectothiorhodospira mobilis]MCG5534666.1 DUF4214 domain-containing protein [Ectothiorhodospira mobilis]
MSRPAEYGTTQQVMEIYAGVWGAAPDFEGVDYWVGEIDAGNFTFDDTATSFFDHPLVADKYAGLEGEDFLRALYKNIFKVDTPDAEGLAYWQDKVDADPSLLDDNIGTLVMQMIDGMWANDAAAETQQLYQNLVTASEAFVAQQRQDGTAPYSEMSAEEQEQFLAAAQTLRDGITADSTAEEIDAAVETAMSGLPGAGETFTLTTGTDAFTPDAEDAANQTTSGADTFEAVSSALSSARTLNDDDLIDGGAGSDTLKVSMEGNFTGFGSDGGVSNVETVELTNEGSIGRTFDATGVSGVESYVLNATGAAVNLANLADAEAAITVNGQASGSLDIDLADDADAVDGSADALSMTLNGVGTADDATTEDTDEEKVVTLTADHIEELALTLSGDNVVDLGSDDAEALTVAGEGSLKMADVGTGLETFDAAGFSGDIDLELAAASGMTSVVTGSGDDTLDATIDDLKVNATIDGGAGSDRLELTGGSGTVQYAMTGIETIALGALSGDLTFSAKNASGIETIEVTEDLTTGAANVFSSLGSGDLAVDLKGDNSSTNDLSVDQSGSLTLNATASSDATSTAMDTNDTAVTATNASALILNVGEYMDYQGTVSANKASSVEAQVDGALNNTLTLNTAASGVFNTGSVASTVVLDAAEMTDLNITAGGDFTLGAASDLSGLEALTVDTDGDFDAVTNSVALDSIAQVNLSGDGAAALHILGNSQDYGLTLTAEGLSDGLATGVINVGAGQSITIDAANVLGDVSTGAVSVDQDSSSQESGSITVDLNGTGGDVNLGTLAAKDVTVNASGALGAMTYGNITLSNSLDFTGAELAANGVTAIVADNDGNDATLTFVGGIKDDIFTVQPAAGYDGELTISATGDIEDTGGADTLVLDASNAAMDIASLTLDGIEDITVNGGNTVTAQAKDVSGKEFDLTAGTLTLEGTSSADTIDLGDITTSGASNINLLGSDGKDTITASGATDVFTYTAESQLGDTIDGFASGSDKLNLDVGGAANTNGGSSYASTGGLFTAAQSLSGGSVKLLLATDAAVAAGGVTTITLTSTAATAALTSKQLFSATDVSATALAAALNAAGTATGFVTNAKSFLAFFQTSAESKLVAATIKNTSGTDVTASEVVGINVIGDFDATLAASDIVLV